MPFKILSISTLMTLYHNNSTFLQKSITCTIQCNISFYFMFSNALAYLFFPMCIDRQLYVSCISFCSNSTKDISSRNLKKYEGLSGPTYQIGGTKHNLPPPNYLKVCCISIA